MGKLKVANSGLAWKEASTGNIVAIGQEEVQRVVIIPSGRNYQLRLWVGEGRLVRFEGVPGEQLGELEQLLKSSYHGVPVERRDRSLKGHTWGRLGLDLENENNDDNEARLLEFQSADRRLCFDLALEEISSVAVPSRHELSVELLPGNNEDKRGDTLIEARWFIPPTVKVNEAENVDVLLQAEEEVDEAGKLAQRLKKLVEQQTEAGSSTTTIASLPELAFVVPRGRYQLDMGATSFRMHGKSYDYRIPYQSILKLFLVPKPDDLHIQLVMALDPPIKQGQTRYPFLICQFDKDEQLELDLQNLSADDLASKYDGKLQLHQEGAAFELVSNLFRCLAGHKIIVPGAFQSAVGGAASLKCSIKAAEGHLYPLERNLLFLPKPTLLIAHQEIGNVEFSRIGAGLGNPRSFDMKISLKSGQEHTLGNLAKEEYQGLEDYLRSKQISITRLEEDGMGKKRIREVMAEQLGDSSEDEDYEEGDDDEEEDEDEEESEDEDYDDASESEGEEEEEEEEEEDDE